MPYTYLINHAEEYRNFSLDAVTQNMPYIEQAAVFGIMNNPGSYSVLKIQALEINELSARGGALVPNLEMRRVSAMGAGVAVTPMKFDSASSDLPALVTIAKYPGSHTSAGVMRTINGCFANTPATALAGHGALAGNSKGGLCFGMLYAKHDSDIQAIVLREGQGLVLANATATGQMGYNLEVRLWLDVGGATYLISEVVSSDTLPGGLLGLFNGAGSGVVVNVVRMETRLVNTMDAIRFLNLEFISDLYGGETVTPVKMDSDLPDLPSTVEVRGNPAVTQANVDALQFKRARMGGDLVPLCRYTCAPFGKYPALASGALALHSLRNKRIPRSDSEIVLREGEGIGIVQRGLAGGAGRYEIVVVMDCETTGAPTGGEASHVF